MDLSYAALMQEQGITFEELPKSIQTGIKSLKQRVHMTGMREKQGKSITQGTIDKIEREDEVLVKEINEYIKTKKEKSAAATKEAEEKEKAKQKEEEQKKEEQKTDVQKKAEAIEKELDALHKTGKEEFTAQEIKSSCPNCYSVIFEAYKKGEDNGLQTSRFSLVENKEKEETFKISVI